MERVWAAIVSQDAYLPDALVLAHCAHSLEVVKSRYPLVVLGTPSLSQQTRTLALARVGIPYVGRTVLYHSREQHDPRNVAGREEEEARRRREHFGWFRVKSPLLWVACTT